MVHTVESIKKLLVTNDKAVGRALMVLTARQTADEVSSETTKYLNGRGFRPAHAKMGVSMAKYFERNGFLTEKQLRYWRTPTNCGKSRIEIYARQLLEEANLKTLQKIKQSQNVIDDPEEIEALNNTYEYLKRHFNDIVNNGDIEDIKPTVEAMREIERKLNLPAYDIGGNIYPGICVEELEMKIMEAHADRKQTIHDETNKWKAKRNFEKSY